MASVECIQDAVRMLVAERQALHERDAGREELESNRLELVGRQQQLSYALIDRHIRSVERNAACAHRNQSCGGVAEIERKPHRRSRRRAQHAFPADGLLRDPEQWAVLTSIIDTLRGQRRAKRAA